MRLAILILAAAILTISSHGQSTFGTPVATPATPIFPYRDTAIGDLTGDCFPDLLVVRGSLTSGSFAVLFNDGLGNLSTPTFPGSEATPAAAEILDANGDGIGDVITSTLFGSVLAFPSLGGGQLDLSCALWGVFLGPFGPGDVVSYGFDPATLPPCAVGNPATIFVNVPPESNQTGVTSLGMGLAFPGLEIVWPFSAPSGTCYLAGDSLGWVFPGIVDLGLPPVMAGDPPVTGTVPVAPVIPSGTRFRIQAVYLDLIPAHLITFGLVATNAIELVAL